MLARQGATAAENHQPGQEQHSHEQRKSRRRHGGDAIRIDGRQRRGNMAGDDGRVQGLDTNAPDTLAVGTSQNYERLRPQFCLEPGGADRIEELVIQCGWAIGGIGGDRDLLLVQADDDGAAGTGLVEVYFLDSTVRAAEMQVLHVSAEAMSFTLFLQVDALPEELPLEVEVLDPEGNSLYQGIQGESLVRDTFLVLHCLRSDFPDGRYMARVRSQADGDAMWMEYPFEVRS